MPPRGPRPFRPGRTTMSGGDKLPVLAFPAPSASLPRPRAADPRQLAQATEAVHAHETSLYAGLTGDDRAQLLGALAKIEATGTGRS